MKNLTILNNKNNVIYIIILFISIVIGILGVINILSTYSNSINKTMTINSNLNYLKQLNRAINISNNNKTKSSVESVVNLANSISYYTDNNMNKDTKYFTRLENCNNQALIFNSLNSGQKQLLVTQINEAITQLNNENTNNISITFGIILLIISLLGFISAFVFRYIKII